jgi:hypothetical protein
MRGKPLLQLVFIYMFCNCDKDGVYDCVPQDIADATGLDLNKVLEVLVALEAPDPDSRTAGNEGRRIIRLYEHRTWGWRIPNHEYYRRLGTEEQRKEKAAERQKRFRSNATITHSNATVTPAPVSASASVSVSSSEDGESEGKISTPPPPLVPEPGKYGPWIARLKAVKPEFKNIKDFSWQAVLGFAHDRTDLVETAVTEFERNVINEVNFKGNPVKLFQGYLVKTMKTHMRLSERSEFLKLHPELKTMFATKDNG